jgi:hypothetical protein
MEDSMRTRNALIIGLIAQIAAAGALVAQKPASKAEPQKAAAKSAQPTTAKAAPAVSADSAKKVLMANVSGATVKSERLHRKAGHEVYDFSYTAGSDKSTHHATVDATSGEFKMTAPTTGAAKENHASASKSKSAPAAKKPGA